jgi:TonB family protein
MNYCRIAMKTISGLFLLLCLSISAFSQVDSSSDAYKPVGQIDTGAVGKIFYAVDQFPEFMGGQQGLTSYLSKNIRYPADAREKNKEGRVIVQFVVCTDGSLCDEKIVRSVDSSMDKEVIRVVKAMPNWKPGKQNGKTVKTYYTLPVTFKLQHDEKDLTEDSNKVYESVQQTPEFPGGYNAYKKFLSKNFQYPKEAKKNKIHGQVILRYIVEVDGSITNLQILRSLPDGCSEEALRLVKAFPKWNPGKQNGKAVRVSYTLPIYFN